MKKRNHTSASTLGFVSVSTLVALAFLAVVVPASVGAQGKPAADADIVARVNNDAITLSDYQKAEQRLRDELAHDCQGCPQDKIDAQFKERQQDLLRGMIDQSLMVQRAKDMGISVESDLAKRLDEVRKQNGLASIDDLQKGVEASGLSWEDYKTTVRKGLLQKELVQREVGSHVDISSDEVKQYYEAHPQEFTLPERVTLSEISLSTEGKNPEELAAVRAKVEGLRTSILNGDDFNRVAQLYSQGSTAKDGGHLGTYKKGEVSPQIEAIVFQMRKDQISDVIQTRTRFEVLKVEDHLQPGLQPLDKVQADILNTIRAQKMQPRMRDYLAELRKQSKIIVTPGYHDSALLSGSNVPSPDQSQSQDQNTAHIVPAYESVLIRPNTTGEAMPPFKITGKPVHGILLKPDRFMATNETLQMLIQLAYDLQETQISGGPAWFNSENYDVDVKMDKSAIDELQKLSPDQRFPEQKRIIQALLTDRFKLALHRETRDLPVHELLIANGDSKLQQAKPGDTYSDGLKGLGDRPAGPGIWIPENGQLIGQGVPIVLLVRVLSEKLGGQIVVDKTGLTGNYDFTIKWAPDASQPPTGSRQGTVPPESLASAISSALQQQLGLKLEVQQAPVEVLVIDDAEQPTQN